MRLWLAENAPQVAQTIRQLWPHYDAVGSTTLTTSWARAPSAADPRPHVSMLFAPALPTGWGDASILSVRPGWSPTKIIAGLRALGPVSPARHPLAARARPPTSPGCSGSGRPG